MISPIIAIVHDVILFVYTIDIDDDNDDDDNDDDDNDDNDDDTWI